MLGATMLGTTMLGATMLGTTMLGATMLGTTMLGATMLAATMLGAGYLKLAYRDTDPNLLLNYQIHNHNTRSRNQMSNLRVNRYRKKYCVVASACHDVHSGNSLPRCCRVGANDKIFYFLLFSTAFCCSTILQLVLFCLFLSHCHAQAQACHSSQI